MNKLSSQFRKWWKGNNIVKIAEGDNDLIVIISKRFDNYFDVAVYQEEKESEFKQIQINKKLTKEQSLRKFKNIQEAF